MKSESFEVAVLDSNSNQDLFQPEIYGQNNNKFLTPKRLAIIIAIACVCALALGLGLGLGLDNSNKTDVQVSGCSYYSPEKRQKRYIRSHRTKRWLTEGTIPQPGQASCPEGFDEPPLLVISMDGFRAEYLSRGFTPTLKKLSEGGVHAPYMRATFPTKTFPNHYTIMTGLYTESHGIIDNTMYDMEWGEQFIRGASALDGKWWGGEPMWLTSKRQGKKSATMFWPGSDANITGEYPDYCYYYDESVRFDSRTDQVFSWLDLSPDERPSFITLYFHEPDSTGHNFGPFSDQIDAQLAEMDRVISTLMDGIAARELDQCINIIILADHGMGELYCGYTDRTVYLDDYLDISQYYIYEGVHGRITSKYVKAPGGGVEEVPNPETPEVTLSKLECTAYNNTKDWYARFYHKSHLPKRFHYASHRRIDDIVIELEDKWQVAEDRDTSCSAGGHGYDNTYKSMHALFMAFGPAFKQNLAIKPFENIEVYNLMAEVLGINPSSNNGTQGRLHHILISPITLNVPPAAASEYTDCGFPNDDTAERRSNMTDCKCDDLEDITDKSIAELDEQLNLTEMEKNESVSAILKYGIPQLDLEGMSVCQLTQRDYISGYSNTHHMPLWSAFTLDKLTSGSILDPGNSRSDKVLGDCIRPDVRLANLTNCTEYVDSEEGIIDTFLYPPGFSNSSDEQLDGYVTSNIVPMYKEFRQGIWQELLFLVEEYAEKYDSINVMTGPIFDYNSDGHADELHEIKMYKIPKNNWFVKNGSVPLPSHYYLSATYCDKYNCPGTTQQFSVVLLHKPVLDNCWDRKTMSYLKENVAKVRDVEILTGLSFYTEVSNLTERVMLQTHLEVGLWPRISWMDLGDDAIANNGAECPPGYNNKNPPVVLISIDGFRSDYIHRNLTPTLTRLRELGVRTDHMRSIYPTMTFPNHYTQVTGLYPESHGIVDNSMCDEDVGVCFSLSSPTSSDPTWWHGEPIWNTLELQNKTAMTMFWPGSDVEIQGIRPTKFLYFENDYPYHLRVDTVLQWLNGTTGVLPDLITLYFSSVDSAGHETGPFSLEVEEVMEKLDTYIQDLMDGIYRQKLHKCANIIIVSDHGMSSLSCENAVLTGDFLNSDTIENTYMYTGTAPRISNQYTGYNSSYHIIPTPEDNIVDNKDIVSNLSCASAYMGAFEKEDLPRRLHYAASSRIESVILKLKDTWQADRTSAWCDIKGQHGWDASFDSMKAFFLAFGPALQNKVEVEPFESIELYNLLSVLTGVTAASNNGTEGSLYHLLTEPPELPALDPGTIYSQCDFPNTTDEYNSRANLTSSGCRCDAENITEYDERLDLEDEIKNNIEVIHLPYGKPIIISEGVCLLHHSDYVSAYHHKIKMPQYTAFTLTNQQVTENHSIDLPDCLRPDVRLIQLDQPLCQDYNDVIGISQTFLFSPDLSKNATSVYDSLLTTNTVPMFDTFKTGVWNEFMLLINQWVLQLKELHIIMGPVFDYEADGLPDDTFTIFVNNTDIPIPSHYYAVVMYCTEQDCRQMNYTVKSFILPHKHNDTYCMNITDYLVENVGRIRDVELLTGIQLLTRNLTQEAIQTRTYTASGLTWT